MKENDFSTLVLIPLLRKLGYQNVQFHGGPNERGRDIIGFKSDSFGTIEGTAFIVKRLKASTAASQTGTFHESVKQLEQAAETPIPFLDAQCRLPTEIVFVTPHAVNVRMLDSRFSRVQEIRANRMKYLDGHRVADLCRSHFPEIIETLLGSEKTVADALKDMYTNNALLHILGASERLSVDCFHVGLDFRVGNSSLNEYLGSKASFRQKKDGGNFGRWRNCGSRTREYAW